MINFEDLKVYGNELLITSPFRDFERLVVRQKENEEPKLIVDKVHEIWKDYEDEFYPFQVYVLVNLDMKGYKDYTILPIYVCWASYVSVPKRKLELETNENINKSIITTLKGYVEEFNENEKGRSLDYRRYYDTGNLAAKLYRDIDGELTLTWEHEDKEYKDLIEEWREFY